MSSFNHLPDVALIEIFRRLDHLELIRLHHSCQLSSRLRHLIENNASLWRDIHLQCTVDYHLFTRFLRLVISNCQHVRSLIVDQLDLTCRKILIDEKFSLRKFSHLEFLTVDDDFLCQTLERMNFSLSTLKSLHLTNEHPNLRRLNSSMSLRSLQMSLYSMDLLDPSLESLTNLNLKIMFDYDHKSEEIFPRLPRRVLQKLTLKFVLIHSDAQFSFHFHRYLNSCSRLRTVEFSYLHSLCPMSLHVNLNYDQYHRLVLINLCPLKTMKNFVQANGILLPEQYFQWNSVADRSRSSSSQIHLDYWFQRQLISIDYLQCVTSSMEIFNEYPMIWSDQSSISQSFELYFLRSVYNSSHLTSTIRHLSIDRIELSLDGFVVLLTRLNSLTELTLIDGKIDQMGSALSQLEKILLQFSSSSDLQSDVQIIRMNNVRMSRRTLVKFSLITGQLNSLTFDDVKLFDSQNNDREVLHLLKQLAQYTDRFRWNQLKSLTLGKNLLHRENLLSFVPSRLEENYSSNLEHLRLIIDDQNLFRPIDLFLKSIRKLLRIQPKLSSFIVELTRQYEGQFRLRTQLQTLLQTNTTKRIFLYPTVHDRACRFCLDTNVDSDDDDEHSSSSSKESRRSFCGIPLLLWKK